MGNTVTNVSAGKPAIGGAIFHAPLGTTLPEDAPSTLNEAFVCLGYCSDDGLVNSNSPESSVIKAWGGDTVLSIQESKDDTFKFTLIEVLNPDVLSAIYGSDNVTGNLSTGIKIVSNSDEPEEGAWVIDMIMRNGVFKRIVIPDAKVSEVGDITYSDSDAVGYETTLQCMPDSDGTTHIEYIVAPSSSTSESEG